jgi:hypothetical protein
MLLIFLSIPAKMSAFYISLSQVFFAGPKMSYFKSRIFLIFFCKCLNFKKIISLGNFQIHSAMEVRGAGSSEEN